MKNSLNCQGDFIIGFSRNNPITSIIFIAFTTMRVTPLYIEETHPKTTSI